MRLIIRQAWDRDAYQIWLMKDKRIAKPFEIEFGEPQESDAFELPPPSIWIRREDFTALRQSIASEALANGFTELVNPFKDQMTAIKYHLEDMRRLVFEPPNERIVINEALR